MGNDYEKDKKLFKIGEVAGIFNVSMGTLRHYEKAGLLKPESVDEKTGYRYYSDRQFEVLNTIRYLRVLDMSLEEIADFLKDRDIDVIEEKLENQKAIIARKQHELELVSRKIDHRLEQIRDAAGSELDVIKECSIPASRIVWMKDSLKLNTYLDLEEQIRILQKNQSQPLVFMGKVGVGISQESLAAGQFNNYELVYIILDNEDEYDGTTEQIEELPCVSIRFNGSHKESPAYYEKLVRYIKEHNMVITGFSREVTLIDNGITNDESKFVTQISIPVGKNIKKY